MSNLHKTYYDPETGYTGIQELVRKTKKSKRQVENFLQKQDVYTLHKPAIRKFQTRRVYVDGIDDQFQADLVDMKMFRRKNKFTNYILTVIDCFSKFAWAVPIKKKTGNEITLAFEKLFKETGRIPKKLQTDRGTEFTNKTAQALFKKLGIHFFTSENAPKAQIAERLNRSLKDRMYRYFTAQDTVKWIDVLPKLLKNYNSSFHRSIKMTPIEASKTENEDKVRENLYGVRKTQRPAIPRYKAGDLVRIMNADNVFRRGFQQNFTLEIFEIEAVLNTKPVTYKLRDLKGEEITGAFYEKELSKVVVERIGL